MAAGVNGTEPIPLEKVRSPFPQAFYCVPSTTPSIWKARGQMGLLGW